MRIFRKLGGPAVALSLGFAALPARAVPVNWDEAFELHASNGIQNPVVLVGFNPQPDPPGQETRLVLDDRTAPSLVVPDQSNPQLFRFFFAFYGGPDTLYDLELPALTGDDLARYSFFLRGDGSVLEVRLEFATTSAGIIDGTSLVGFNPQPDPPADLGPFHTMGLEFAFTSLSDAMVTLRILDQTGAPLQFAQQVPEPPSLPLLGLAMLGLMATSRRHRAVGLRKIADSAGAAARTGLRALRRCGPRLAACLLLIGPMTAHAVTIVEIDGPGPPNSPPNNPTGYLLGTGVTDEQYFAVGWTQSASYTEVAVTALLSGSFRGEAHLTRTVGAGTTVADEVATDDFLINLTSAERTDVLVLSGLTLDPGSYFLTLEPAFGSGGNWWSENEQVTTLDLGVSYNGVQQATTPSIDSAFVPASGFGPFTSGVAFTFAVTGERVAAQVPEPATGALLGVGLAMVGLRARRRDRRLAISCRMR